MLLDSSSKLSHLAYEMLRIRKIEEAIALKYSEEKMRCPVHLSIGQEAIAVGVCSQLSKTDLMVSNHRAHAHYLAKGGSLRQMMAEIYGKKTGCSKGRGGSMHLVDLECGFLGSTPIVGGSIPVGVGAAFGSQLQGKSLITVIFLGEGATEEGVFAESLNFAALKKLNILFVCENNLYSVYSPLEVRQPAGRDRVLLAKAHGLQASAGEGNRLDEVVKLTSAAIDSLKKGNGPYFLEFSTYRYREHCGPHKDPFRPNEEVFHWEQRDPLLYFPCTDPEKTLEIEREIEEAFAFAESSPFPSFDPSEETIYA